MNRKIKQPRIKIMFLDFLFNKGYFKRKFIPVNSLSNYLGRDSVLFAPFRNGLRFSKNSQSPRNSFVSGLLFHGRPPTIFFRVVSVVIYAVNGCLFLSKIFNMLQIRLIHVFLKVFKRTPKAFNALSAIAREIGRIFVSTPAFNIFIGYVKSTVCKSMFVLRMIRTASESITATTAPFILLSSDPVTAVKTNPVFGFHGLKNSIIPLQMQYAP